MFTSGLGATLTALSPALLYEEIEYLKSSSINTFELNSTIFNTDYDRKIRQAFKEMLDESGKKAISYHIPFTKLDDLSCPEESIRQKALSRFRALLEEASFFKSKYLILHPSSEPIDQTKRDLHIEQLRKSMQEIEKEVEDAGMQVALEFLPRLCLGNKLADMEKIIDGFSSTFGICLDVNHLMDDYKIIPELITKLNERLYTLHICDYDGIDEKHWMPGTGVIDWKNTIAALKEINYQGPFNYETKRNDTIIFQERVKEVEENYKWMKSFVRD